MILIKKFLRLLFFLNPIFRLILLISIDTVLIILGVFITFYFQGNSEEIIIYEISRWLAPSIFFVGIPFFALTGQYFGLTKYSSSSGFYRLAIRNFVLIALLFIIGNVFQKEMPSTSSWLLLWLIITTLLISIRLLIRDIFLSMCASQKNIIPKAAIYGAGSAGAQLALSLRLSRDYQVISFFDDNEKLWGRTINGIKINSPREITKLKHKFSHIFLAIPSIGRSNCRQIIKNIENQGLSVSRIPSLEDLTSGKARIDSFRPINIEDLLGRDPAIPNEELLRDSIHGSVVCVTGAGGSIGSELCRQIAKISPSKLILLEISEPNLYDINEELCQILPKDQHPIAILGSASDQFLVEKIFIDYSVDVVFHAAAYKHVPLVETNPIQGISNNVFSTFSICKSAEVAGVKKMLLISSDKAVRPKNVMGASKRLAELVVQAFAEKAEETSNYLNQPIKCCYSMVRFGNVLNSSGSVVPLFQNQIMNGGPITLTNKEAVRFFMTIPEAAQLVLQAVSLAKRGGEVYLLDMGEPVRILDLAKKMIRLNGLTIKEPNNPKGDIEISITGLRAGEKLYEELLIDATANPTDHPLIFSAKERKISYELLFLKLKQLEKQIKIQNTNSVLEIVLDLVSEWESQLYKKKN